MDPKVYMCYITHCRYKRTQRELVASWNRERPSPNDEAIFREMATYMEVIRRTHKGANIGYTWDNCGIKIVMNFMSKYITFDNKI